jgi:glutamate-1-semialdehyde 2,1-aminomutase
MITGFRWGLPGAHSTYKVIPDLLTFGKAIANGYSVALLGGRSEVMEIAGIRNPGQERVFLLSSTHGAEMSSLAAMTEAIDIQVQKNIPEYLLNFGGSLQSAFNEASRGLGLSEHISMEGYPSSPTLVFKDHEKKPDQVLRTLFMQEMVKAGVLIPWVALSRSHGGRELDLLLKGFERSAAILNLAMKNNPLEYLEGQPAKPVFRKFN